MQEERFTRKKHDSSFPINAIRYCLQSHKLDLKNIENIVYYEKPFLTFERLLETYLSVAPRGLRSFIAAMQLWLKEKLFLKSILKKNFISLQAEISPDKNSYLKYFFPNIIIHTLPQHFFPSPYEKTVILCMDGVGEWATTSA